MESYSIKETTPLAFHNFFYKIVLPFGFLITIVQLVQYIQEMEGFTFLFVLDIVHYVLFLFLGAVSFWGLRRMQTYAWYSTMAFLAVNPLFILITLLVIGIFYSMAAVSLVPTLLSSLVYGGLVGLYYWKRKPLFFPPAYSAYSSPTPELYGWDVSAVLPKEQNTEE